MAKGIATVTAQMKELLDEYNREAEQAVNEAAVEASDLCVNQLKNTSPKRPGSGKYARSWTVKKERAGSGVADYIVHNKGYYQLTHLLENGHVIRNGKGTYGRTSPIHHIGPAADSAIQRFDLGVRARLGRLK